MLTQIAQMVEELKRCEAAGASAASVILVYVFIDTLAYIGMPISKETNDRSDFKNWVDRYLKADSSQRYQYRGKDVYAARCATLHTYSAKSEAHAKDNDILMFGYHDGGRHAVDPAIHPKLVMIGIPSLIYDFIEAVERFLFDLEARTADPAERVIVEQRLSGVFGIIPFAV